MYTEEKQEPRLLENAGDFSKNNIAHRITPQKLLMILKELSSAFIKLGQILSVRPDLIPQSCCEKLPQLRFRTSRGFEMMGQGCF